MHRSVHFRRFRFVPPKILELFPLKILKFVPTPRPVEPIESVAIRINIKCAPLMFGQLDREIARRYRKPIAQMVWPEVSSLIKDRRAPSPDAWRRGFLCMLTLVTRRPTIERRGEAVVPAAVANSEIHAKNTERAFQAATVGSGARPYAKQSHRRNNAGTYEKGGRRAQSTSIAPSIAVLYQWLRGSKDGQEKQQSQQKAVRIRPSS